MTDTKEVNDVYLHAGGLLMFSSGEYSDYGTNGCFVALEDLKRSALLELVDQINAEQERIEDETRKAWDAWRSKPEGQRGDAPASSYAQERFIAACIRKGWLLSVTYTELHIGGYGLELAL
jgi:hypothetical protein